MYSIPHLVTGGIPDLEDPGAGHDPLELGLLVEDGTAVGTIALLHVDAGRVRLLEKLTHVADRLESLHQEARVVNLLETDDVRREPEDLLDHPPSPVLPVQAERRTPDEPVTLHSKSLE